MQEPLITVFFAFGIYVALVRWHLPLARVLLLAYMLAKVLKTLQKAQKEYQNLVILESAYWDLRSKIEEAQGAQEPATGTIPASFSHSIRLEGVWFSYEDRFVLKAASLWFPKGSFSVKVGSGVLVWVAVPAGVSVITGVLVATGVFTLVGVVVGKLVFVGVDVAAGVVRSK